MLVKYRHAIKDPMAISNQSLYKKFTAWVHFKRKDEKKAMREF